MKGLLGSMRGLQMKSSVEGLALTDLPKLLGRLGTRETKSGVSVTVDRALEVSVVFACLRVIANGVAQVPLKLFRDADGGGSEPAKDHPLYNVLYRRPNTWQTSFQFRTTLVFHRGLTGNFYAFKNMVGGEIKELLPIEPDRISVKQERDLSLTYVVSGVDGTRREFPASMIWHVRGPSWNSWLGLEAVRYAREAIGLSIAAEASQASMHKNGLQTSGLFSVESTLEKEQYEQLRAWIDANISDQVAGNNRFGTLLLDRKASFTKMAMTGVDAQHLETRRMQIEEICRGFGVFPQMIGHAGDQTPTFASAEAFFNAHNVHTLSPWYEDLQQSIDVDLIGDDDVFAKFVPNGLMMASAKDQSEYFAKALGSGGAKGWLTQNEVRAKLDLNPLPGGYVLPEATNLAPPSNKPPAEDPPHG